MFREAKKMKKGTGLEYDGPNLLAVLILSPMVLMIHLFLGGTYRVLMVSPPASQRLNRATDDLERCWCSKTRL
jgi:hypothetical protein